MLKKGCATHVLDLGKRELELKDIPIVKEFPNVFL
jgi:hypothetical protein